MGVLSALAGLVFTAQLNLANPKAGTASNWMPSPRCSSAARRSPAASERSSGAIIGGLIIGVLNNGMSILGVGTEYQQLIKGLVLLAAVAFDVFNKRRAASSAK